MPFPPHPCEHLAPCLEIDASRSISSASPDRPIIGMVNFVDHRGERAEAILDGEGRWLCPRMPVLDRVLSILFEPKRDLLSGVPFGHDELGRVARWLKGKAEFPPVNT